MKDIEFYKMFTEQKVELVNMMDTLKSYLNSPYLKKCRQPIEHAIREISVINDYVNQQRRIVEREMNDDE